MNQLSNLKIAVLGLVPVIVIASLFGLYLAQTLSNETAFIATSTSSRNFSCTTQYPDGINDPFSVTLSEQEKAQANICVKFVYYNATNGLNVYPQNEMTIYRPVFSPNENCTSDCSRLENASGSFVISSNAGQFMIGGPYSMNEGIVVDYAIQGIQSTPSGTYEIGFNGLMYPKLIGCGYGLSLALQVGSITNPLLATSCFELINQSVAVRSLGFEIVGLSNSTQLQ